MGASWEFWADRAAARRRYLTCWQCVGERQHAVTSSAERSPSTRNALISTNSERRQRQQQALVLGGRPPAGLSASEACSNRTPRSRLASPTWLRTRICLASLRPTR